MSRMGLERNITFLGPDHKKLHEVRLILTCFRERFRSPNPPASQSSIRTLAVLFGKHGEFSRADSAALAASAQHQ